MQVICVDSKVPWKGAEFVAEILFANKGDHKTIVLQERRLNEAGDRVACWVFVPSQKIADLFKNKFSWNQDGELRISSAPILVAPGHDTAVQRQLETLFATL